MFMGIVPDSKADDLLRKGEADALLFLRSDNGQVVSHIEVDASNPVVGQASAAYLKSLVSGNAAPPVLTETLYNPQLKSAYNFVPGIMGMIFILICAIMTSVSIVSEKETGTMDLLLVSPVKPGTIIIGKLIPYFLLSCMILAVMLVIAYTVLGLPMSHTLLLVIVISMLYIILSLSIGLFVSTIVDNQVSALIVAAVLFMLPVIMLSGMIFPIDNMPAFFQWVSCLIPARWYTAAMRKLMIQQLDFQYIITEFSILVGMTVLFLVLSIKNSIQNTDGMGFKRNLRILGALLRKEMAQMKRNPIIPKIILIMPVMVMLLLPMVATMDVKNVDVTVVDNDHSQLSRRLIADMDATEEIKVSHIAGTHAEAVLHMEKGNTDVILTIPPHWEREMSQLFVEANGVNATKGTLGAQYVTSSLMNTLSQWRSQEGIVARMPAITVKDRYNPTLNFKNYMIPALLIILLIIICGFCRR